MEIQEGCVLVAVRTGEGWALAVENMHGDVVAYLDYKKVIGERTVDARELRAIGYEIQ